MGRLEHARHVLTIKRKQHQVVLPASEPFMTVHCLSRRTVNDGVTVTNLKGESGGGEGIWDLV